MKKIVFLGSVLFLILGACSDDGSIAPARNVSQQPLLKQADLFANFECISPFYCSPVSMSEVCSYNEQKIATYMKDRFNWQHVLPHTAITKVTNNEIIIRFRWDQARLQKDFGVSHPPFIKGQAWEISLMALNKKFVSPYPDGNDFYPFNTNEFSTNMPCGYRDVQNFTAFMPADEHKKALEKYCGLYENFYTAKKLDKINQATGELTSENVGQFAVGTSCPESLKSNTWYYIIYKVKPGSDPASSYSWITSSLIEDTFVLKPRRILGSPIVRQEEYTNITDCPYTNGIVDFTPEYKYICGRGGKRKVWIKRLCVPTDKYIFTPGKDIHSNGEQCNDRKETAYQTGDGDGWFDIGIQYTRNYLLHGTNIGDCSPTNYSKSDHTDKCGWYNVGHVAPGKHCFWSGWDCFADESLTIKHHPENFISTFLKYSVRLPDFLQGSYGRIGKASSWVHKSGKGLVQYLRGGVAGDGVLAAPLSFCGGNCVFYIYGLMWVVYKAQGGVLGQLGYPKSDQSTDSSSNQIQYFENGYIQLQKRDNNQCGIIFFNGSSQQKEICPGSTQYRPAGIQKSATISNEPLCSCQQDWNLECWSDKWTGPKYSHQWVDFAKTCVPIHKKSGKQSCPNNPVDCTCDSKAKWQKLDSKYGESANLMNCSPSINQSSNNYGWVLEDPGVMKSTQTETKSDNNNSERPPVLGDDEYVPPQCINGSPICLCPKGVELECWSSDWGGARRATRWVQGAHLCTPIYLKTGAQPCPNDKPFCKCGGAKWIKSDSTYGNAASIMTYCSPTVTPQTNNYVYVPICSP